MWVEIAKSKVGKLDSPSMVVAVSTSIPQYRALYSQARELAEYVLKNTGSQEIAKVHSSALSPEVLIRESGLASLQSCSFNLIRGKRDIVLFSGDSSPMEEQHEFSDALLDYAVELGVTELYSIGARWTENPLQPEQDPEVIGFATDTIGVSKLKRAKLRVLPEEPAPFFSSMVVAMAGERGIRGFKLSVDHGEPVPHHRSVRSILTAVHAMTGLEVPLDGLEIPPAAHAPQQPVRDASIYR